MTSIIHLRMKNRALFPLCVCSIYDSKEQFYWSGVSLGESASPLSALQSKAQTEAFEKYICHLSNYLNAPRRMQMNWLLQAANFNDCSQITSYCLIESEWNGRLKHKHTAVLTALTRDSLSKKEVLLSRVTLLRWSVQHSAALWCGGKVLWISCFLIHKGLLGVTKQSGSGMLFTVWQQIFENLFNLFLLNINCFTI